LDCQFKEWIDDIRNTKYNPFEKKDVISTINKKVGRKAIPYSEWVTVEKRRASEGVFSFYVRYKNEGGELKVGLVDYMKVVDFEKYFANNNTAYQAYRQQLMAVFKTERMKVNGISTQKTI
jgi:hypothetical protein